MAVVITISTLGHYKVFSSTNATLATAISEVLNELEKHNISLSMIQFTTTYDAGNSLFAYIATCKNK